MKGKLGKVVQAEGLGERGLVFSCVTCQYCYRSSRKRWAWCQGWGTHHSHHPAVTSHLWGHLVKLLSHDHQSCNSVRSPSHWWSRGNPVSHLGAAWRLLPWAALYISSLLTLCLDDFCHKKLQNFVGKKKSKIKSKTKFTKNRGNRKSRASLRMALSDWKSYHVSTLSETIELLF